MLETKAPNTNSPLHPGLVLKKDFMDPIGLTVTELSARVGVSRNTISSIINKRSGVSADMALRLSQAFRTLPDMWLKLQLSFDLFEAERRDTGWKEVEPLKGYKPNAWASDVAGRARNKKRLPRVRP
ncbi:MAG: HigA family addiction module antidote protein [Deltaproteobacteria bacterium]|jgi:addiction module HigA family antidote|nr:HigA family addiction module antidote protein [Deltaproteobacteria bacterium]